MPKRKDIQKILIIGSGPIVIGQACEFDYSGTQACKALKEEGFEVVLINSNPATIMTDPEMADKIYIEPIVPEIVEKVIAKERPQVLLPTLGGQTALNVSVALAESGVLDKYNVELIGAKLEAIKKAEDRDLFKKAMKKIGIDVPKSGVAKNIEGANQIISEIGFPVIIRPAYTLGGTGGGTAFNYEEFQRVVAWGINTSPINEVLVEESIIGWKEYELEVMRDLKDNVIIICSIENFDPMGIHTGDSITVAPAQTLTDKEYQLMRDAAIKMIREIGVETGGSNVQFGLNPKNGKMVAIEINPRVSRSSALASKATGFPIAKIAAKLAVGYTLDEISNDITKETKASFEPTIDYVVVKVPRWAFEKFPETNADLGVCMKSVGEAMAIGRTFKEALQKALRSLEIGRYGLGADGRGKERRRKRGRIDITRLIQPSAERIFYLREALMSGVSSRDLFYFNKIDPWFIDNIKQVVELEKSIENEELDKIDKELFRRAKRYGFSDFQIAYLCKSNELKVRSKRKELGVLPVYKMVDTCGAEFEAYTPYLYSTYEEEDEALPTDNKKVVILGSGPNRIGQGIEFDYCCVHVSFALREEGYESIMVNSNPETVSTDYDISDRLYFEPLTFEDVLNIIEREKPIGVILQFGGQTPLKLAKALTKAGVKILGTSSESIDLAEDRERFSKLLNELNIRQAPFGTINTFEAAKMIAEIIGYPILVRPSYVLGGAAMAIVYDEENLEEYVEKATEVSPEHPILIDKFLEDAIEVDVDAICDGQEVVICGIMEHIERAGIHSGDSACVLPIYSLEEKIVKEIKEYTIKLSRALNVIGLINIQYAVKREQVYILEANPRASRTVPFVSKATGVPWAKIATKVMMGRSLKELGISKEINPPYISVKEAVLPFIKFPKVDIILGPEMKSTGEVMGIDDSFGKSFAKSQMSAYQSLPLRGSIFISVTKKDKEEAVKIAEELSDLGFKILATRGTARSIKERGVEVEIVYKANEGRPDIVDYIKNKKVDLIINTPLGEKSSFDEKAIRETAINYDIPCITTISAAKAALEGIKAIKIGGLEVKSIQEYHKLIQNSEVRIQKSE
ncbi:MAG: carbamoyl-phosphate synthase large subunit [bacterium]|nr:carbamoyl-phosphate synthase large subunit [bacterium]